MTIKAVAAALVLLASPAFACEDGHWVSDNLAEGRIIKLEDGSVWKIAPFDAITTSLWLAADDIIVCDDSRLIHVDDGEQVAATRVR